MVKKGRNSKPPRNPHVVGSAHPGSKFTEAEVLYIREQKQLGVSMYSMAKKYGVSQSTMQRVATGKRYKNV